MVVLVMFIEDVWFIGFSLQFFVDMQCVEFVVVWFDGCCGILFYFFEYDVDWFVFFVFIDLVEVFEGM